MLIYFIIVYNSIYVLCISLQNGICDRAFSPSADMVCRTKCQDHLCAKMCEKLAQDFPIQSDPQGIGV